MKLGKRLLLIVSERIGDAIFCTPAITLLRHFLPESELSILAPSAAAASVFEHNPAIKNIYTAPDKKTQKEIAQNYNNVIDFHNNKITCKYSANLQLPTARSPRTKKNQHQSAVANEFIASLLNCDVPSPSLYLLYPQDDHFKKVQQLLTAANINFNNDILIGCHIGCSQITRKGWKFWKKTANHKSWPLENFQQLEEKLRSENSNIRFILTGSNGESHLCQQITAHSKTAVDLSGKTSVLELAALMRYLTIFLTGDTGPLHIACATSIPVVTLFGPTSPIETGPYPLQARHTIIQQSRIENITVENVYNEIREFVAGK